LQIKIPQQRIKILIFSQREGDFFSILTSKNQNHNNKEQKPYIILSQEIGE